MKLTTETYKQGMEVLSNNYLDWKFDFTNPDMVSGWYAALSELIPEQDFIDAIRHYILTMEKGPNSPVALKKPYAEKCIGDVMTPVAALSALRELLSTCELDDDDERVVESLAADISYRPLYITYLNMRHLGNQGPYCNCRLNSKFDDSYTCTWFINEYKKNLESVIEQCCRERITALPSGSDINLIGG